MNKVVFDLIIPTCERQQCAPRHPVCRKYKRRGGTSFCRRLTDSASIQRRGTYLFKIESHLNVIVISLLLLCELSCFVKCCCVLTLRATILIGLSRLTLEIKRLKSMFSYNNVSNDNVKTMWQCESGHSYRELSPKSAAPLSFMDLNSELQLTV